MLFFKTSEFSKKHGGLRLIATFPEEHRDDIPYGDDESL